MLLIQVQPILNSILLYADEASAEYCACSFFIILITSLSEEQLVSVPEGGLFLCDSLW